MLRAPIRLLVAVATAAVVGCGSDDDAPPPPDGCADRNPQRNVYFGDLHVHTALSFDSYAFDIRNTPEDAYRFARGEAVELPPLDGEGRGTQSLQLDRPLDFAAVTEHAEFLGEVDICLSPGSDGYDAALCEQFRANGPLGQTLMGAELVRPDPQRDAEVCGADGSRCATAARSVWDRIVAAAETFDDPTPACAFSTLVGYEWTANTAASARHRNVIFRGADVPFPTSYMDASTPRGLWRALRRDCLEADRECDVLAIPHNSNQSNGHAFFLDYAGADPAGQVEQAELRARMEPLVEIIQHKGESECANGLSGILGAPDELCDFEKLRQPPIEDCGDGTGSGGVAGAGCVSKLDFARGALLSGLEELVRIGVNPLRLGFVGSTDTHNGTPGAVEEYAFLGHRGSVDDELEERLSTGSFRAGPLFNPGGLAAVWAEENSREAIFDGLARREAYATSGPRMSVRFFAAPDFADGLCEQGDMIERAYRAGVPMGAVVEADGVGDAPAFLVSAMRDPGTEAHPGVALQRIQIIKGWVDRSGQAHQRVYEVAGDAGNGASVDAACRPTGEGFDSLCTVWRDPDYDASVPAFYYARVIENPSCRWTALQCMAAGAADLPACADPELVRTVQERAWTSPIWFDAD